MKKRKGLAKWIWILLIILFLVLGLIYIVFTEGESEKVIDLRDIPGPPAPKSPTGFVTFPNAPNTPGLPPEEGNICTSVDYTVWSECRDNLQTRAINFKFPKDCVVENPVLSRSCIPVCSEYDWSFSLSPLICPLNKQQTKTWSKVGQCERGVSHPDSEIVACNDPCVSIDYSGWSECGENGKQTKTILSKSPENCDVGNPVLEQACDYIPDCKEEDWMFTLSPSTCPSNGEQTKTWSKVGQCKNGVQKPNSETISCDYQAPICNSVSYSSWGQCGNNNIRTRTIISKNPVDCVINNPVLLEQCDYVPECTEENWVYVLNPLECPSTGEQTKTWSIEGKCAGGIQHVASETVSCDYQSSQCVYVFSEWDDCKPGNIQTRTIVSESPEGCQGNPLLEETCEYVPFCAANQIVQCDEVENGVVTGHKNKCDLQGTKLLDENTCTFVCNEGYDKVFDRCISKQVIADYKVELDQEDLELEDVEDDLILRKKEDNKKLISIADLAVGDLDISSLIIKRSSLTEAKEYIIVKGLLLVDKTKTIYLEKKDLDSNGVCIKDSEDIENLEGIVDGCTKINCPSTGEYDCVVEENTFIVSNLRYSGVVEDKLFCGDNVCLGDESCSSCPGDCGECPAQRSSGGGGGGGGSSTRPIPLNDTQNVTGDIEVEDDVSEESSECGVDQCLFDNGKCYEIGKRKERKNNDLVYCSGEGIFDPTGENGAGCTENYECNSFRCSEEGKCVRAGIFKEILEWLRNFFR